MGRAVEVRKNVGFIQLRLLGVFFVKEIFREEFDDGRWSRKPFMFWPEGPLRWGFSGRGYLEDHPS